MKKKLLIILMLIVSLVLVNCKNYLKTENGQNNKLNEYTNPYNHFGVKHNEILYSTLVEYTDSIKILDIKTKEEGMDLYRQALINSCNQKIKNIKLQKTNSVDKLNFNEIYAKYSYKISSLKKSTGNLEIFEEIRTTYNLNVAQNNILNSIETTVSIVDPEIVESIINELNVQVEANFNSEQIDIILKQTSVLVYSSYFWRYINLALKEESDSTNTLGKKAIGPGGPGRCGDGESMAGAISCLRDLWGWIDDNQVDRVIGWDAAGAIGGWKGAALASGVAGYIEWID